MYFSSQAMMELLIFPSNAKAEARRGIVSQAAWGNSIIKHGGSTHVLVCGILKDSIIPPSPPITVLNMLLTISKERRLLIRGEARNIR